MKGNVSKVVFVLITTMGIMYMYIILLRTVSTDSEKKDDEG